MKSIRVFAILLLFSTSFYLNAENVPVNPNKSTVIWTGSKIGGSHTGTILLKSGSLDLKDGHITGGVFTIDMTSIVNKDVENPEYNKKLVDHLMSDDFFGVSTYPEVTFVITNSTKFVKDKATVSGEITIKNKTEIISFEVMKKANTYKAKIDVDRSKFDVKYGSKSFFDNLGDKVIYDIFNLEVSLVTDTSPSI